MAKSRRTHVTRTKARRRKKPARIRRIIKRKVIITRRTKRAPPKRKRKPPTPSSVEYSVNVSYKQKSRPAGAIGLQFSVTGPPKATKDEVLDAITDTIRRKGRSPKGYDVRIVSWKDGRVPRDVPWGSLAIIAGEPATRFSVQRSRSD